MHERAIVAPLLAALADTPVVFLDGARQTGKSTLVRTLTAGPHPARYLTLDDATLLAAASSDAAGFIAGLDGPVIIDEVQRAPALYLAIKAAVDRDRRPGRFLLTGSADALLLPKLADALVGRMERFTLWPLSQGEIAGVHADFVDALFDPAPGAFSGRREPAHDSVPELMRRLTCGGYPEALTRASDARRRSWFDAYVTTLLQRDVKELARVEGLNELPRLLGLIAARTSTLLNFAELSRSIAFPQTTLKRYLALLEAVFLVQTLPAWSTNLGKRQVKTPKVLLHDSGLAAHLLGLDRARLLASSAQLGPLLESFVVMELKKQIAWSDVRPNLFHYRTHTGHEVDIVLESPSGDIVGVEVKASATVAAKDLKGLHALAADAGDRFVRGLVLYTGTTSVPFAPNLHALPIAALWSPAS